MLRCLRHHWPNILAHKRQKCLLVFHALGVLSLVQYSRAKDWECATNYNYLDFPLFSRSPCQRYENLLSMAQGCILPISNRDSVDLRRSLQYPETQRILLAAGDAIGNRDKYKFCENVTYPLANPSDPTHKVFVEYVMRNVQGNESVSRDYERALPRAIAAIAKQTPDILGLVTPSLGKGASAVDKTLKHRTKGDAFAYELLGTAELVRLGSLGRASKATNGGPELRIWDNTRIDLGVRFNTGHNRNGAEQGDFRPTSKVHTGKSETFEADMLARRDVGLWPLQKTLVTGVDFKHSRNSTSYSINPAKFESKVDDVARGIVKQTLGLRDFHYMTNGYFDDAFKNAVSRANETVMAHQRATGQEVCAKISLHEHVQYPLN